MHEPPERGVVHDRAVDIDDMRAVIKGLLCLTDGALHMIDGQISAEHVGLGDKDNIGLGQPLIVLARRECRSIYDAAVVPRTPPCRANRRTLNLNVELLPVGNGVNVKADAVTVEILERILRDNFRCVEVRIPQDNLNDEINARETVLKDDGHKGIVKQTKTGHRIFKFLPYDFTRMHCHAITSLSLFYRRTKIHAIEFFTPPRVQRARGRGCRGYW